MPSASRGNKEKRGDGIDQDCTGKDLPFARLPFILIKNEWAYGSRDTIVQTLTTLKVPSGTTVRMEAAAAAAARAGR